MRSVIGGEFELDPILLREGNGPRFSGCFFSSGRAALFGILAHLATSHPDLEVLLPEWLCESVVVAALDTGLPVRFYPLASGLVPDVDAIIADAESRTTASIAVLVVDYFGIVDVEPSIRAIKTRSNCFVIRDDVQALFEMGEMTAADFRFTSFRKTLPAPDGALVEAATPLAQPLLDRDNAWALEKTIGALLKHITVDVADEEVYLRFFEHAEDELDEQGYYDAPMSEVSRLVLSNIDLAEAARKRIENFRALTSRLEPLGIAPIVPMSNGAVPLCVPVLLEERDRVRRALADERIFAPVHWPVPSVCSDQFEAPNPLWRGELSLPCDQRYDVADMERIAEALRRCRARALHN